MKCSNALISLLVSLSFLGTACRKKPAQIPTENNEVPQAATTDANRSAANKQDQTARKLEVALDLWKKGQKDEATEVFLSIQWDQPLNFSADSVFALSEKQFIAMPESKRNQLQQQALDVSDTTRDLAKHVISLGRAHLANKDYNAAEKCFTALSDFGKAVSDLDTLLVIKMTGNAIRQRATKELTALREEAPAN